MTIAICFERVTKCYRLGNSAGSLRDVLAGLTGRLGRADCSGMEHRGMLNAVQDLSFTVEQGESLGIIGRNGAGKTTVLRMLSGITRPTSGYIARRGRVSALIELGAGFHPDLTGRENVYLNGSILGLKRREIDRLFDEIVAFAELERFIDTPVKRYSSGMYVRLGFAVAAHTRPDILLVDEVLSVGDQAFQAKCLNRIGEMQRDGMTAVIVSHNLMLVRRHCSRAIVMEGGHALFDGENEQAIRVYSTCLLDAKRQDVAERRVGSGASLAHKMHIEEVSFLDSKGQHVDTIASHEPFTIQIRYRASLPVSSPILEVVLHSTALGTLLARIDNRMYGVDLGHVLPGEGTAALTIGSLPLKNDRIEFSVALFNSDYTELFDWHERAYALSVESTFVGEGLIYPRVTWGTRDGSLR